MAAASRPIPDAVCESIRRMKISVEVPVMNAQGKSGKPGKTITLTLDSISSEVTVTMPAFMIRDPVVGLAGLEAAVEELRIAERSARPT